MSYSEQFKDHFASPRNAGEIPGADALAERSNPVCGDRLRLSLRISGGLIVEARFLAYGCPPTLACGSALTEMLQGLPLSETGRITRAVIIEKIGGLPPRKRHAAALAVETLRAALDTLDPG